MQTFLTIWRWGFGLGLADVCLGMFLLWLWTNWTPKPVQAWLSKRPWLLILMWIFGLAIVLTLSIDRLHRWGQRHFDTYRVVVLIIAILGIVSVVAGISFDPLLELGMVLVFWVLALILWERGIDDPASEEEKRVK